MEGCGASQLRIQKVAVKHLSKLGVQGFNSPSSRQTSVPTTY